MKLNVILNRNKNQRIYKFDANFDSIFMINRILIRTD